MICFTLILKHIKQVEADMEEVDVRYFLKRWFVLSVLMCFCLFVKLSGITQSLLL